MRRLRKGKKLTAWFTVSTRSASNGHSPSPNPSKGNSALHLHVYPTSKTTSQTTSQMTPNPSAPFWESLSKGKRNSTKRREKSTHSPSRKDMYQTGETTSTQTYSTGITKTSSSPQVITKFINSPWTVLTPRTQKFTYGPG